MYRAGTTATMVGMAHAMPTILLPSGEKIPVLGQGTWHLAEVRSRRDAELAALRRGLDLGMTLIDTAEMYADGGAELLVGEAIDGRRDQVFLVSKVLPWHATRDGMMRACQDSLRRLGTDRIDLYLLHWRGPVPLAETVEAFLGLRTAGLIRYWGVSNFDVGDLQELMLMPGGSAVAADQVLYNLARRAPEFELLPECHGLGIPVIAYSPVEQGRLLGNRVLRDIALRHGASAAQIALAWVLRQDGVCAIPRSGQPEHVYEDRAALDIYLDRADLTALDEEFPPPLHAERLEML
jgi:diketogulonate reductase-like aldo/keto reductase